MSNDLDMLRLRNLIASREMNTAQANQELSKDNGWLWDHTQVDRELCDQIDRLMDKIATAHGPDCAVGTVHPNQCSCGREEK